MSKIPHTARTSQEAYYLISLSTHVRFIFKLFLSCSMRPHALDDVCETQEVLGRVVDLSRDAEPECPEHARHGHLPTMNMDDVYLRAHHSKLDPKGARWSNQRQAHLDIVFVSQLVVDLQITQ